LPFLDDANPPWQVPIDIVTEPGLTSSCTFPSASHEAFHNYSGPGSPPDYHQLRPNRVEYGSILQNCLYPIIDSHINIPNLNIMNQPFTEAFHELHLPRIDVDFGPSPNAGHTTTYDSVTELEHSTVYDSEFHTMFPCHNQASSATARTLGGHMLPQPFTRHHAGDLLLTSRTYPDLDAWFLQ
jgi:hypothetical protein